eukprot:scaffold8837_cov48-Cylindrotheca_fusiformis.AAC.1
MMTLLFLSKIPVTYAKRIVVEVVFSKLGERNGFSLVGADHAGRGRMLLHQYIRGNRSQMNSLALMKRPR